MLPEQDLYGMDPDTEYYSGWEDQQKHDDDEQTRAVAEAFERIYRAISELELLSNCGLQTLREDVRFLELCVWRK